MLHIGPLRLPVNCRPRPARCSIMSWPLCNLACRHAPEQLLKEALLPNPRIIAAPSPFGHEFKALSHGGDGNQFVRWFCNIALCVLFYDLEPRKTGWIFRKQFCFETTTRQVNGGFFESLEGSEVYRLPVQDTPVTVLIGDTEPTQLSTSIRENSSRE
jgi:hypothetical protein